MGFNPPVPQQDSDWEIRVAVLLSLLIQVLLIFLGPLRKRSSHRFPRFLVWSCYLLADWVADLALGLLLNNMGNIGSGDSTSATSFFVVVNNNNKRGGSGAGAAVAGNNNSTNSTSSSSSSPIIFAFWTPFLLLHLGGPDTITAYSLEDNELWLRHLIGLLFELFSALVIFGCSLRGNPMIPATVLIFLAGTIKYVERTYSLYSGSVSGFRDGILDDPDPGPNYAKLMTEFDAKKNAGLVVEIAIADGEARKLQEAAEREETRHLVLNSDKSVEARAYDFFLIFRRLFVNLILSFKERRLSQAFFLTRDDPGEAFEVIEVELNYIYDMVYTKAPVVGSGVGWVLRLFCSGCLAASLVIFLLLHDKDNKHGISRVDAGITYALLLGGLALDAAALLMLLFSNRTTVYLEESCPIKLRWLARLTRRLEWKRWPWCYDHHSCIGSRLVNLLARRWAGKTSQLNLIGYCVGKPDYYPTNCDRRRLIHRTAKTLRVDEIVDDIVFIQRHPVDPPSKDGRGNTLLDFIFRGLKEEAKRLQSSIKEDNAKEELKKVCDCRGERVVDDILLPRRRQLELVVNNNKESSSSLFEDYLQLQIIRSSVDRNKIEFDESVLLWHIATDLCLLPDDNKQQPDEEGPEGNKDDTAWMQRISRTLSEYMLYLLIKQPEMLSATAGIGLLRYRDTCAEARRFFGPLAAASWNPAATEDEDDDVVARRMLLSVNTSEKPAVVKGDRSKSVLFDAVILAKALGALGDPALMWEVIAGVWREMLTFAAGKCRGSTHVRELSRGGELITLVWFLMAHMGLGDMYQIQAGDAKAKLIVVDQ